MIASIQRWIVNTVPFIRKEIDRRFNDAVRRGSMDAFAKAHADIMETMADDLEVKAKALMVERLASLLSNVDESQVVAMTKTGIIHIGGQPAEQARLLNLRSEAEMFGQSELWKILNNTVRELAQRSMFVAGDSIEDMKKGRSILYMLDSQNRIIDTFRKFIPK